MYGPTDAATCPFCGESGFDLVGLKIHLIVPLFGYGPRCQAFEDMPLEYPTEKAEVNND